MELNINYLKLIALNIKDLYVHITNDKKHKLLNISSNITILTKYFSATTLNTLHTVLHQNYFQLNEKLYKAFRDVAMAFSISVLIEKVFSTIF
jgi:hypothetical protein